jgi:lipid-A-disaccharide synthase
LNGSREPKIRIVDDERYDAVGAADLIWVASGTATLETGLLLKPMVIVYRVSWLTYVLARLLVKVDHIGMVNLIAGERVVPELIQSEFKPERLVEASRAILQNRETRLSIVNKLTKLREKLGSPGASDRVADLAFAMMA